MEDSALAVYSLRVQSHTPSQRSPTRGLLLGLVITLTAVLAYASYITMQFSGLRKLQSEMVDRNRKDSLQLLRIQNDLNSVALAMRDMLDARAIDWPSGRTDDYKNLAAGKAYECVEARGITPGSGF